MEKEIAIGALWALVVVGFFYAVASGSPGTFKDNQARSGRTRSLLRCKKAKKDGMRG